MEPITQDIKSPLGKINLTAVYIMKLANGSDSKKFGGSSLTP